MTPDRWQRVKELVALALEREPQTRIAFLEEVCAGDEAVRWEVQSLVTAYDRDPSFIEEPALSAAGRVSAGNFAELVAGRRIGRYEVARVIGTGGMGTVYEAVQDHPRRTVALKVMRAYLACPAAVQRFEYESQILARLHHAGIAHIYEAGTHDDGSGPVPYFAMEYIPDGRTIIEYARANGLSTRQRLELFAAVCDTVHHGHQMGVVHRDLKPANILIDPSGQPKVIDFGVARVTDSDTALVTVQTGVGQLLGTVQYMSPEQCRGDPSQVDIRSDVYSLGMVLFELLAGEPPYDLCSRPIPEALRAVGEQDAKRLSSVDRVFRGDLDTIVARALEKDKGRRYQSASELAADIRRYLRDEPVLARPASSLYQFHKLALRHKAFVIGAALILMVSVIGFVVSMMLYGREQAARGIAAGHAQIAERRATDAEEARRLAEFRSYQASVAAAGLALRAYDVADARRLLERAPEYLRNWEWRHFTRRLDRSRITLRPHAGEARCLALSPDGTRIAVAVTDRTARVWDAGDAKELATLPGHPSFADGIAFSPDGSLIATGAGDLTVKLWNAHTYEEIASLVGRPVEGVVIPPEGTQHIHSVAFSPDGAMIGAASWEGAVRLWDVAARKELAVLTGHAQRTMEAAFSPDGATIASGSCDKTIKLWNVRTRREVATLLGHKGLIYDVEFSPDGSRIASASEDNTVRLWDAGTTEEMESFHGHTAVVFCVAFDPTGKRIASGSIDNTVRIWDVASGRCAAVLVGHESAVRDVAWSPDGAWIASASRDGTVKLWDAGTDEVRTLRGHTSWVYGVAVSPNGKLIASAGGGNFPQEDMTVRLWDRAAGQEVAVLPGHQDGVLAAAFSPDGSTLASGGRDRMVKLWDVARLELVATLRGHEHTVCSVAFSPDGTQLASGSRDTNVILWDATTGDPIRVLSDHGGWVWSVTYSPDGRLLAAGVRDGTVKVWDPKTATLAATLTAQKGAVRTAVFSPDGRRLAAGGDGGEWIVWGTTCWDQVAKHRGHTNAIYSLAFSPDGTRLVSASADHAIKLWDVGTWDEVATLHGHANEVWSVVFTPDGRHLVSGSSDLTVRVWDAGD